MIRQYILLTKNYNLFSYILPVLYEYINAVIS